MREITFAVVDDALFIRTVIKGIIQEVDGYKVVGEASNGCEAIELAKQHKPDVMTLDITMPDMSGMEAINGILGESPSTRIIIISAMGQKDIVLDAIRAGAGDFVVKPFEKSIILQAVKNVLAR